jgi:tetratricopeptide (TPR) repeat protein
LCSSAITIYAQKADGAISSLELLPLGLRIENAVLAYVLYMAKLFWPVDLGVFYPLPASIPLWQVACSLIILLGITIGSLLSTRRQPYLLFGWCWFLVTLLPVIGIIQVGGQSLADRYTYIPLIGLLVMMAWGIPAFMQNLPFRKFILTTLALLTITTSAILTWHQLDYWQDSITLYRHTLRVAGGSFVIHNNLGLALADEGLLDEAIGEYQKAIEINPSSVAARSNLGVALASKGSFDAAIREYKAALAIDPDDIDLYNNLGVALARSGAMDEAIEHFRHALTLDPYYAKAYNNLGLALMNEGLVDEAITAYRKALEINPDYSAAYDNLSQALAQKRLDQGR